MPHPVRRLLLGPPLPTAAEDSERLTRPRAMGAFGLDALSSVAYGPDEILYALLLAGSAGLAFDLPVAAAIAALLAIVAFSYRQTIYAYPHGGGSYTVAKENLGLKPGLVAAAALMVDYLTTVAVSVTAGTTAIVAFLPALNEHRVLFDVALILILIVVNLRGVREAGSAFVLPTYLFIGSLGALLAVGAVNLLLHGAPPPAHPIPAASQDVTVFLILRAFAGGCTAMTGVEAIANGVPAFKPPSSRNAAGTLITLALILGILFLGVAGLGREIQAVPTDESNVMAQIGRAFVGGGSPLFYLVQISAAIVLMLAANTSFNGFPRLAAVMSEDGWFPHRLSHRGFRLAYSNGIITIGALAILLVVAFNGSTHALIPLFAVGVFLCFTLSQAGMVRHWRRERGERWRRKATINGTGALVTGLVTLIVVGTKFTSGAWIVVLLVPLLVAMFYAVHRHYTISANQLALAHLPPLGPAPRDGRAHVIVPVRALHRATAAALEYARSISDDVLAVHIAAERDQGEEFALQWREWTDDQIPLRTVPSPYREVIGPLVELIVDRARSEREPVTVVVPAILPHHAWQEPLHNQLEHTLAISLLGKPDVVVTSVPVRLR
ncbi:MAG: APC family permease [Solirubrobacterales bacterium]